MITLADTSELKINAVFDAGVPNRERMLIEAFDKAEFARYFIAVCWQHPAGNVTPIGDFYWLGDNIIMPPTLFYLYTGVGTPQVGQLEGGKPYMTAHMGRPTTLFNRLELVPVLVRIDSIFIGRHLDTTTGRFIERPAALKNGPALQLPGQK